MGPVSCVSWMYSVDAAETHETIRWESGMRYQPSPFGGLWGTAGTAALTGREDRGGSITARAVRDQGEHGRRLHVTGEIGQPSVERPEAGDALRDLQTLPLDEER